MYHNLNLNWLRSFESSARLLSFTAAALELGMTQAAISQHINALESRLGDKLFVRRPKSLLLTDVGKAYLTSIRGALDSIEVSTTGLFGPRQASTITVRASMALIVWLSSRLDEFQNGHRDICLKLITSIWKNPDDQQPIDVDIVLAPRESANPNFEKLSDEAIVPVSGVMGANKIKTPGDLLQQRPIHILGFDDHWARYLSTHSLSSDAFQTQLMTDTSVAAMEMASAELGCAMIIEKFARQAVRLGRDICIVGDPVLLRQSHYLVRSQLPVNKQAAVEAFENWLRKQFS